MTRWLLDLLSRLAQEDGKSRAQAKKRIGKHVAKIVEEWKKDD